MHKNGLLAWRVHKGCTGASLGAKGWFVATRKLLVGELAPRDAKYSYVTLPNMVYHLTASTPRAASPPRLVVDGVEQAGLRVGREVGVDCVASPAVYTPFAISRAISQSR